jgi:hypothetical protein
MKRMACLVLLVAPVLAVAGCGSVARSTPGASSTAAPSPSEAPPPSSNPLTSPAASLTEADSGRSLQVARGGIVSVVLHEPQNFSAWSVVASSDASVLAPVVDTRAAAARGVTLASFQAAGPGTAQLTSSAAPACPKNVPCPAVQMAWTVTVKVT